MSALCECGCGEPAPIATRTDSKWGAVKGEPRRFIRGHSGHRWEPGYGRVDVARLPDDWRDRITVTDDGCWLWDRLNDHGYGLYGSRRTHRLSYQMHVGPIPAGAMLDHVCHSRDTTCRGGDTCRHRACLNPDHLEPVTHAENVRRGRSADASKRRAAEATHCPHGHAWTPENTKVTTRQKKCRACMRAQSARNNEKRREVA